MYTDVTDEIVEEAVHNFYSYRILSRPLMYKACLSCNVGIVLVVCANGVKLQLFSDSRLYVLVGWLLCSVTSDMLAP